MSFNSKHVLGLRTMEIFTLSEYLVVSSRTGKVFRVLQPDGFSVGTNYLKTQEPGIVDPPGCKRSPYRRIFPLINLLTVSASWIIHNMIHIAWDNGKSTSVEQLCSLGRYHLEMQPPQPHTSKKRTS